MTLVQYEQVPIRDCGELLVDLAGYPFVQDLVYFYRGFSSSSRQYLREGVAEKLVRVQEKLDGYRFKIWDPWRSRAVQDAVYQGYWNELNVEHPDWTGERLRAEVGAFVTLATDPLRIPPHATGGAVDLTLVDQQGRELDMGTGFDHFGPESGYAFEADDWRPQVREHRKLLRESLITSGFRADDEEWWHFDYGTQLWAFSSGNEYAMYDEISEPAP